MKMNKKGFTLIEMLVVIAIIAVLVSIVIPVVSNSTDKAGAAANAANLRSVYAEMQTEKLAGVNDTAGYVKTTVAADGTVTFELQGAPASAKTVGVAKGVPMVINSTTGEPTYDASASGTATYTIKYFAKVAETGKS